MVVIIQENGKNALRYAVRLRTATQDAFFPADFTLSSPQGVSKGEIGKIHCTPAQLQMTLHPK